MSEFSSVVTSIAPTTTVTADRIPPVQPVTQYQRGTSTFAQALAKVQADPEVTDVLEKAGKLASPDTTLNTLLQASAQDTTVATSLPNSATALNQALQNGAARLRDATRLGSNLSIHS